MLLSGRTRGVRGYSSSWKVREKMTKSHGRAAPNLCINRPNFCQTPTQSRPSRAQLRWNKWNRNCSWGRQSFEFEFFKTAYKQKVTNSLWKNITASTVSGMHHSQHPGYKSKLLDIRNRKTWPNSKKKLKNWDQSKDELDTEIRE